ncbi:MAG: hypothetical protein IPN95_18275, partial [Bacteroidetes bacterium]|nr:hypothetical protein [Bacteroidota bacterium]
LLRLAAVLQLGKGAWLMTVLWNEPDHIQWVVIGSHVAVAAIALLCAQHINGRPLKGKIAASTTLVVFGLLQLPKDIRLEMEPPWNFLLTVWQNLPICVALLAIALVFSDPEGTVARWKNRFPRLARLLQIVILLAVSLIVMENGLRYVGIQPGFLYQNRLIIDVDSLQHYQTYSTNEDGIFAYSDSARNCLRRQLTGFNDPKISKIWPDALYFGEDWIQQDHLAILRGDLKNGYSAYLDSIRKLPANLRDPVDQAYLDQLQNPINADGFRSIPFRNDSTRKRKILLLGDSFTWGHSAMYFSSAFSDLLIPKGFAIYNSGISATDPAQYEAIARKFVPIIRPDVVVVNLYMGNDIFHFKRPLAPFQTPFYLTNAGVILAYPGTEWLPSADSAYAFVKAEQKIPAEGASNGFNQFCSQTSIGTMFWRMLRAANIIPFQRPNSDYWKRCEPQIRQRPVTGEYLRAIQNVAQQYGAQCIVAVIPENPEDAGTILNRYPDVFEGMKVVIPMDLDPKDYTQRGGHFNDAGHRKFASMLENALK